MNNKHLHQAVMRRFSEHQDPEALQRTPPLDWLAAGAESQPRHLSQFLKLAEHRKRQMLEKMLLDA